MYKKYNSYSWLLYFYKTEKENAIWKHTHNTFFTVRVDLDRQPRLLIHTSYPPAHHSSAIIIWNTSTRQRNRTPHRHKWTSMPTSSPSTHSPSLTKSVELPQKQGLKRLAIHYFVICRGWRYISCSYAGYLLLAWKREKKRECHLRRSSDFTVFFRLQCYGYTNFS